MAEAATATSWISKLGVSWIGELGRQAGSMRVSEGKRETGE